MVEYNGDEDDNIITIGEGGWHGSNRKRVWLVRTNVVTTVGEMYVRMYGVDGLYGDRKLDEHNQGKILFLYLK